MEEIVKPANCWLSPDQAWLVDFRLNSLMNNLESISEASSKFQEKVHEKCQTQTLIDLNSSIRSWEKQKTTNFISENLHKFSTIGSLSHNNINFGIMIGKRIKKRLNLLRRSPLNWRCEQFGNFPSPFSIYHFLSLKLSLSHCKWCERCNRWLEKFSRNFAVCCKQFSV